MSLESHQLINQTSGSTEWYTPPAILDAARRVLGTIDLDPASSIVANERVKAVAFYIEEQDGLAQEWRGRVWLNHPFGRLTNRPWIAKLETEFRAGRTTEAICITYACTSEAWFKPLLYKPQCFLIPRTNYYLPDGSLKRGVTKGSVVTYYGPNVTKFAREFATLGVVKVPIDTMHSTQLS